MLSSFKLYFSASIFVGPTLIVEKGIRNMTSYEMSLNNRRRIVVKYIGMYRHSLFVTSHFTVLGLWTFQSLSLLRFISPLDQGTFLAWSISTLARSTSGCSISEYLSSKPAPIFLSWITELQRPWVKIPELFRAGGFSKKTVCGEPHKSVDISSGALSLAFAVILYSFFMLIVIWPSFQYEQIDMSLYLKHMLKLRWRAFEHICMSHGTWIVVRMALQVHTCYSQCSYNLYPIYLFDAFWFILTNHGEPANFFICDHLCARDALPSVVESA